MTQILTAGTPDFIVQSSDRLVVAVRGGKYSDHDPCANKTVVYRASDALVTIGYSGIAYIGNMPTDEWIAQTLAGESLRAPDGSYFGMRIGGGAKPKQIGYATKVMREAVEALAARAVDIHGLYITIAGWQAERGGQRPIMMELSRRGGVTKLTKAPRVWDKGRNFRIDCIGAGLGVEAIRNALLPYRKEKPDGGPSMLPDIVEQVFVDLIRQTSAEVATVGSHVLSVVLMRPDLGISGCRFLPMVPHLAKIVTADRELITPVAYTPWIISAGLVHAPSVEVGDTILDLGGVEFHMIGVPGGNVLAGLSSSVNRPPPP